MLTFKLDVSPLFTFAASLLHKKQQHSNNLCFFPGNLQKSVSSKNTTGEILRTKPRMKKKITKKIAENRTMQKLLDHGVSFPKNFSNQLKFKCKSLFSSTLVCNCLKKEVRKRRKSRENQLFHTACKTYFICMLGSFIRLQIGILTVQSLCQLAEDNRERKKTTSHLNTLILLDLSFVKQTFP